MSSNETKDVLKEMAQFYEKNVEDNTEYVEYVHNHKKVKQDKEA